MISHPLQFPKSLIAGPCPNHGWGMGIVCHSWIRHDQNIYLARSMSVEWRVTRIFHMYREDQFTIKIISPRYSALLCCILLCPYHRWSVKTNPRKRCCRYHHCQSSTVAKLAFHPVKNVAICSTSTAHNWGSKAALVNSFKTNYGSLDCKPIVNFCKPKYARLWQHNCN